MASEQEETSAVEDLPTNEVQNTGTSNQEGQNIRASNQIEQNISAINQEVPNIVQTETNNGSQSAHEEVTKVDFSELAEDGQVSVIDVEEAKVAEPTEDHLQKIELTVHLIESTKRQKKERKKLFQQQSNEEQDYRESKTFQILRRSAAAESDEMIEYKKELLLQGHYDNVLIEEIKELSSSSSSDIEFDVGPSMLSMRNEFLEDLDYIPNFSDLSTEEEKEDIKEEEIKAEKVTWTSETAGCFVDPLTGTALSSSLSNDEPIEVVQKETTEAEEAEEEGDLDFSDFEFFDEEKDIFQPVISEPEDIFEQLITVTKNVEEDRSISVVDTEALKAARELKAMAIGFVNEIINKAVDYVDYIDPDEKLTQNLDKLKLLTHLKNLILEYSSCKCDNVFLNRKAVDYFKVSKGKRFYDPLPPEIDNVEYIRYMKALENLDYLRKVMQDTKYKNAVLMSSVLMDLQYIQKIVLSTEEQLENTMKNTLNRRESESMRRFLDREMRQMKYLRNDLSDTRLFLITRKHTLAMLNYKIEKIEQITPELSMTKFISMQNELQAIEKKLEERTGDLNKSFLLYNQLIHKRSQSLEKTRIASFTLEKAKELLKEKQNINWKLRNRLYKLKMEHNRMRQEKHDLAVLGGLVTNVMLMHDYDNVMEYLAIKKQSIIKLRNTMNKLEHKIDTATNAQNTAGRQQYSF